MPEKTVRTTLPAFIGASAIPALFAVGAICVIVGAGMIYAPAGYIVAGVLLIAIAVGLVTAGNAT